MSKTKSLKKYVARGQYQGETVAITGEIDENTVMVKLVDDHGKVISERFPMSKGDLEDWSNPGQNSGN